jgi:hypothetical protein
VARFLANVELYFESDSLSTVGADLRRFAQAAQEVGFEMRRGSATEAPPDDEDDSGGTSYGPLIEDDDPERL